MYEYAVIYWIYVLKYVYRLKMYYLNVLLIIYIYIYKSNKNLKYCILFIQYD